ncbi:MAG: hypothetical protein PHS54_00370 [Clostridia bacterium]|nr:hypothetical protein [Clostridia bacterium]
MNYKKGLQIVKEMNIAGGPGGAFGYNGSSVGDHGGDVGNSDFYAPGDSRTPKVLGMKNNDPYEYVKKGKKTKKSKNTKIPFYKRAFMETIAVESIGDESNLVLNCFLYTENFEYRHVITDLLEAQNIPFTEEDDCVIIEGTDIHIQSILEKIQNILTSDPFLKGEVVALIGEMFSAGQVSDDNIPGGLASHKTIDDFYSKYRKKFKDIEDFYINFTNRLNQGIRVEKEHTTNIKIAREIAADHLWEDLDYYAKLAKIEKRG